MIKVNSKDMPKTMALVGGIVVVFFVIVARFNSLHAPANAAQQNIQVSQPVEQLTEGRPQTLFASNETQEGVVLADSRPVTEVNPFRRVLPDPDHRYSPAPSSSSTSSGRAQPISTFLPGAGPATSIDEMPVLPAQVETSGIRELKTTPDIKLEGVLTGAKPVAVLSVGAATHVLEVGQGLGNGYVVRSIGDTTVRLQRGKEQLTLRLQ